MSRRKPVVWVVIHCEYFQTFKYSASHPRMDEMVFHVAGTLLAAERYIRKHPSDAHGWWKVERRIVDETDWHADDHPETHFYNYLGHSRKKPPHASALRAFEKYVQENASFFKRHKDS